MQKPLSGSKYITLKLLLCQYILVKNNKTGEEKELNLTIASYEQWRKDNPDWDKDWSKGCASAQEVGDWQNKLVDQNPGWNDVLGKAAQAPGSRVKKI